MEILDVLRLMQKHRGFTSYFENDDFFKNRSKCMEILDVLKLMQKHRGFTSYFEK